MTPDVKHLLAGYASQKDHHKRSASKLVLADAVHEAGYPTIAEVIRGHDRGQSPGWYPTDTWSPHHIPVRMLMDADPIVSVRSAQSRHTFGWSMGNGASVTFHHPDGSAHEQFWSTLSDDQLDRLRDETAKWYQHSPSGEV